MHESLACNLDRNVDDSFRQILARFREGENGQKYAYLYRNLIEQK